MTNDKMVNDSMELRIREVAQQLFFEQGYAATISIASLTVCTFVSQPMFQDLLSQTDDQVREYIVHRKSEVIRMVKKILKP